MSGVEGAFYGDADKVYVVAGVTGFEAGKAGFFGAFKDGDLEAAVLVEVGDKDGYMEVLAHSGEAAGVVGCGGGAHFGVYRGQVDITGFVDGEGVEEGLEAFYPKAGIFQVAGVGADGGQGGSILFGCLGSAGHQAVRYGGWFGGPGTVNEMAEGPIANFKFFRDGIGGGAEAGPGLGGQVPGPVKAEKGVADILPYIGIG
jgi:hypothetical protein